jgi:glycine/D-amino acid oxidase-like deaminating enzyme
MATSSNGSTVIIGAGVVGLASAYHLLRDGRRVTIVDRDIRKYHPST